MSRFTSMGTSYVTCRNISSRTNSVYRKRICPTIGIYVGIYKSLELMELSIFLCFSGNYSEALLHYEKGIDNQNSDKLTIEQQEHIKLCLSGIARTSIKHGDHRKGVSSHFFFDRFRCSLSFE